ncbi:hypothetical protein Leryth_007145 [Lithospermum erythrorhizon]|nr:hypothetical protein Leryth_007145 [Lithospermum erythrorhizon]
MQFRSSLEGHNLMPLEQSLQSQIPCLVFLLHIMLLNLANGKPLSTTFFKSIVERCEECEHIPEAHELEARKATQKCNLQTTEKRMAISQYSKETPCTKTTTNASSSCKSSTAILVAALTTSCLALNKYTYNKQFRSNV